MAGNSSVSAVGTPVYPLLLVTEDACLARLISLETQEMALSLETVSVLPSPLPQAEERTVLLDLDLAAVPAEALLRRFGCVIGICRTPERLSARMETLLYALLPRPFSTHQLRQLLLDIRGDVLTARPSGAEVVSIVHAARPSVPHMPRGVMPMAFSTEQTNVLLCGDRAISLSDKEGAMMRELLRRRGEAVPYDTLDRALQSEGKQAGQSNKTEVYMCHLRRKLEKPLGLRLITTVRGVGYRLEWGGEQNEKENG